MKRLVTLLYVLSLFLDNVTTALENATIVPVSDSVGIIVSLWNHREHDAFKQRINLAPFNRLNITVTDVPSDIWFIVLQIHTFQYNATLSYDKALLDKVSNRSLFGSNIGLYLKTYDVTAPIQVFLKHNNVHNLDALLVIVTYGRNAPIPGGCNMEFDIEVAPYQKLRVENEMIIVDAQPASVLASNGSPIPCEKDLVQHKMYRLYLPKQDFTPETYFDAIANMLTTQNISRNGDEIPASTFMSSMRRIYSAYIGTGFVYVTIATYKNYSSAYVPIFTYACNPLLYPESCQVLNDTFAKVICALVLITGCLSIIIGHKCPGIDRLLPSCIMSGTFGYILAIGVSDHSTAINVLIGLTSAILTLAISALFTSFYKLNISLRNLSLAFLCACITYLYAPVWMFYILQSNWLFWPLFIILILFITLILTMMLYLAEMITCATFGSFLIVIVVDYYTGSNLKYIIITIIRRVTIPEFHLAFVYPPFQSADLTLIIIWIVLIITRFIIQGCTHLCCGNNSVIKFEQNTSERTFLRPNRYDSYSGRQTKSYNHRQHYFKYNRRRYI
ncbi:hypothetical protein P5V15_011930 [Pogonomyrmex californicus]